MRKEKVLLEQISARSICESREPARRSGADIRARRVWLMLYAVSLRERSTCRALNTRCSGCP